MNLKWFEIFFWLVYRENLEFFMIVGNIFYKGESSILKCFLFSVLIGMRWFVWNDFEFYENERKKYFRITLF